MRRITLRSFLAALLVVPAVLVGGAGGTGVMPAGGAETCDAESFGPFTAGDPRLQLNNDASITSDGRLRVTPSVGDQAGSAFTSSPITLTADASFSTSFSFQFSEQFGGGADGLVFVVQTVSSSVGAEGGGIGYDGLEDSVGVEFDNWFNSGVDDSSSHVGIDLEGNMDSVVSADVADLDDPTKTWFAWVDYDGTTDELSVRFADTATRPDTALLTHVVDLATVLGSSDAYVGFTSGTGSAGANHDVLTWTFANCFAPLGQSTPPTVDAGPARTGEEDTAIALDGTVTDADPEETVTTAWTAPAGTPCTFATPGAVDTTVTCTEPGTYTLTLTANDGVNPAVSDTVQVEVTKKAEPKFKPIGYRMVAFDGGVFTFGERLFHGSLGNVILS